MHLWHSGLQKRYPSTLHLAGLITCADASQDTCMVFMVLLIYCPHRIFSNLISMCSCISDNYISSWKGLQNIIDITYTAILPDQDIHDTLYLYLQTIFSSHLNVLWIILFTYNVLNIESTQYENKVLLTTKCSIPINSILFIHDHIIFLH